MKHGTFIASDGAKIAFSDTGPGTRPVTMLCLAGLTRSSADFDYMRPYFKNYRIISMDYRGRGKSEWTGVGSYNVVREGQDAIELLDHLEIPQVALVGTSRGGLIGILLGMSSPDRLLGLCLNDIGPTVEVAGLTRISEYLGKNPTARTYKELAKELPEQMLGFHNVSQRRWLAEARKHFVETKTGLEITYDPELREAFMIALTLSGGVIDLWPWFDVLPSTLPLCLIHGQNSDLLSDETVQKMREQRPDMIYTVVPDRAHVPFLDEPESLKALRRFLKACHPKK